MTNDEFKKLCDKMNDLLEEMQVYGYTQARYDEFDRLQFRLKADVVEFMRENEWKLS